MIFKNQIRKLCIDLIKINIYILCTKKYIKVILCVLPIKGENEIIENEENCPFIPGIYKF